MWQKFTERLRAHMFRAEAIAFEYGSHYIGTEHLLLALLDDSESYAMNALSKLGANPNRIRAEVERNAPRERSISATESTITPRAKRVLDLSYDEARQMDSKYVGSEHLLLGLIREGDGLAGRVLAKVGLELEPTRKMIMLIRKERMSQDHPNQVLHLDPNVKYTNIHQPAIGVYSAKSYDPLKDVVTLFKTGQEGQKEQFLATMPYSVFLTNWKVQ